MAKRSRKPRTVSSYFLASEVATLAGLSRNMVDYLCRHGLLTASLTDEKTKGHGHRRRFNFQDVLLARAIKQLLNADVSVLKMEHALKTLRKLLPEQSPHALRNRCIVIKAGKPYLATADKPAIDLDKGQMAFAFMIEAEDLWEQGQRLREARSEAAAARLDRAYRMKTRRLG